MPRKQAHQWQSDQTDAPAERPPSKSARKRESLARQELGKRLTQLDPALLGDLPIPAELKDAIALYRRISDHEGRRRQMQFIGRLMREIEIAPLEKRIQKS